MPGSAVTCPLHSWVIGLDDGEAEAPDEGRAPTVPVRIVGRRHLAVVGDAARPAAGRPCDGEATSAPPVPIAVSAAGLAVASDGVIAGDPDHPGQFRPALLQGRGAGRHARRCRTACCARRSHGREASWDEALDLIAGALRPHSREHGPDAVAFYVSGQFLTEDYYVANKLMKGFIGTGNIDTNSRLCMASSVAGHVRAFGEDVVPGCYDDLEEADLVVLVGSNMAWCHPVLYQRLMAAARRAAPGSSSSIRAAPRPRDRRPASGAGARRRCRAVERPAASISPNHGALRPRLDRTPCRRLRRSAGGGARRRRPRSPSPPRPRRAGRTTSRRSTTGSPRTERVVTLYSQGVNQSSAGTDKVNAIINCHLATGRIGRAGMGPFSLTGQPNAMGGREVGGLANQLAAHMSFDDADDIDRVRPLLEGARHGDPAGPQGGRPVRGGARRPGQGALDRRHQSRRPACRAPARVREALAACPFVVVGDCWPTDTTALRRCRAAGRRLGRKGRHRHQFRALHLAPARLPRRAGRGAARLVDVDARSRAAWAGAAPSPMRGPADIFREHAALSAFENDGRAPPVRHRRAGRAERRGL